MHFGTKLAVALAAVPHVIGTAVRFISLRQHVDRTVLIRFGILSAAGGLIGALLNTKGEQRLADHRFRRAAPLRRHHGHYRHREPDAVRPQDGVGCGALSGLFGGLVGNQGGIRSGALLGFDLPKESFVATATAIALVVDAARLPVYFWSEGHDMVARSTIMIVATIGVVGGTLGGVRLLRRIPERIFRRAISAVILALGVYMLVHGIGELR